MVSLKKQYPKKLQLSNIYVKNGSWASAVKYLMKYMAS